jgi:putative DNA primase/helicase
MSLEFLQQKMLAEHYPAIPNLQADGEYHRFEIDGHKNKPGYCLVHQSATGLSAVYGDFVSGNKYRWTFGNDNKAMSPEEREALKKQLAKEAKEIEEKIKRKHEKGAMGANFFWNLGEDFKSHGYLESKKVQNHGLKRCTEGSYAGWLMVAGYNAAGELCTVQYINRDGQKRFETDSQKKGAFFEITGDGNKIIIAEGYSTAASIYEAAGHTVIVAFDAGNLQHVAKVIREKHPTAEIVLAADNDQWKPDIGNTGVESAKDAATGIDAKIAIPEFKDTATEPTDFNDLANLEGFEAVRATIDAAKPIDKLDALKAEIEKIIKLDPLEQETERSRLAKKYGYTKGAIGEYIKQQSRIDSDYQKVVEEVEPAAEPVDGAKLLDGILADLNRRVILPAGAAEAISLWVLLTYCHKAFNVLPLLGITSPTKRCGKTTLIEILQGLTNKRLAASSLTPAAAFRTIEKYSPTLLIDEADTFLKHNDELRGIFNSGHTRGTAHVIRTEGDNHEPVKFSTWGPKAIGMIGTLPETLEDRSIVIQLARKMPGEKIVKTGLDFAESSVDVRARCRRWVDDSTARLKALPVTVPPSGNDRADDNWLPLFTIANVIGGGWPERAVKSMQQLVSISGDDAIGTKLLTDIRGIFEEHSAERLFSSDLVDRLKELTESPWSDRNKGQGLTTNGLSGLLKPFKVTSKNMRIDKDQRKGYTLESFKDVFKRYIPHTSNVPPSQFNDFNSLGEKQNVPQDLHGTDESHDNQLNLFNWDVGTDEPEIIQRNKGVDLEKTEKWETGTI